MQLTEPPNTATAAPSQRGSGESADNSLRSTAEAPEVTLVRDGKRFELRHFGFAACGVFYPSGSLRRLEISRCTRTLEAKAKVRRVAHDTESIARQDVNSLCGCNLNTRVKWVKADSCDAQLRDGDYVFVRAPKPIVSVDVSASG